MTLPAKTGTALSMAAALLILCLAVGFTEAATTRYERSVVSYSLPDVTLINQNSSKVRLGELVASDRLVVVDFIYGTCTTICPVLSASFVNLQRKLGPDSRKVHLVSISIDPENDTPKVMKDYLKRFQAKPGWDFLTGSRRDIDATMKGFDAYIPDKMSHFPLTLIRRPQDGKWIRLNGFMSNSQFIAECQKAGLM